jgi:hypothetical protein
MKSTARIYRNRCLGQEWVSSTAQGSNCAGRGDGVLVVESRSGRRIEVGRGFDAVTLERLLTVLDKA